MLHSLLYHCSPCFFDAGSPTDLGTFSPNVFPVFASPSAGVQHMPDDAQNFYVGSGVQIPVPVLAEQAFLAAKISLQLPHIVFKK